MYEPARGGVVDDVIWLRGFLNEEEAASLDCLGGAAGRPGTRIATLACRAAAALARVTDHVACAVLPDARIVRAVSFAKDDARNWSVPWHQDRIIAIAERYDTPGFGNWSRKAGAWHCEPPLPILKSMCFARVHLDDCDAGNGAMVIARGSHCEGIVRGEDAARVALRFPQEVCVARRGDVQILPMLTLHRSSPSSTGAPRRALRLDFAGCALPPPLEWAEVG